MPSNANSIDISLLGKEYRVACPPENKEALLRAAAYADGKMREIAEKTRGNVERVAVMAALNIAHEFLLAQNRLSENSRNAGAEVDIAAVKRRIAHMEAQLDALFTSAGNELV
jgi:cell division protein ZapA